MWIYLLRHGAAQEPRLGLADEDRALTEAGQAQLEAASGAWCRAVRTPNIVWCSPFVRARETAKVFMQAVEAQSSPQVDAALTPSGDPAYAVTLLEGEMLARTEAVAVVGHEPHLGYLLGALMTGQQRLSVPLQTGMLVGLKVTGTTTIHAELRFALSHQAAARLT